jgi:hypothetical protein
LISPRFPLIHSFAAILLQLVVVFEFILIKRIELSEN